MCAPFSRTSTGSRRRGARPVGRGCCRAGSATADPERAAAPSLIEASQTNGPILASAKAGRDWTRCHHASTRGCSSCETSSGAISSSMRLTKGTTAMSASEYFIADQPGVAAQTLFHLVEHQDEAPPGLAFFLCRIGPPGGAQPGFLALLARHPLQPLGQLLVRPLRCRLRQAVLPVEDDEIADPLVGVADPVAHLGAPVGIGRPQRRLGPALVEELADRAALVQ